MTKAKAQIPAKLDELEIGGELILAKEVNRQTVNSAIWRAQKSGRRFTAKTFPDGHIRVWRVNDNA